jgi:hypothetical protein
LTPASQKDVDGIAGVPVGLRPAVVASINGPGVRLAAVHDALVVPIVTDEWIRPASGRG